MKRNLRQRTLAFEQLESKAAPSSVLMVVPAGGSETHLAAIATTWIATHSAQASDGRYATDQILRFVAENTTGGGRAHRSAVPPTAAQCAAADDMMKQIPIEGNSSLVLGFYDSGSEL